MFSRLPLRALRIHTQWKRGEGVVFTLSFSGTYSLSLSLRCRMHGGRPLDRLALPHVIIREVGSMSEYERRGPVSALLRGARCGPGGPAPPQRGAPHCALGSRVSRKRTSAACLFLKPGYADHLSLSAYTDRARDRGTDGTRTEHSHTRAGSHTSTLSRDSADMNTGKGAKGRAGARAGAGAAAAARGARVRAAEGRGGIPAVHTLRAHTPHTLMRHTEGRTVAACRPPIPPLGCLFSFFLSGYRALALTQRRNS